MVSHLTSHTQYNLLKHCAARNGARSPNTGVQLTQSKLVDLRDPIINAIGGTATSQNATVLPIEPGVYNHNLIASAVDDRLRELHLQCQ